MGQKNPVVSRSRLSTETRFTTTPRKTPAAPVHSFTPHHLKLSVLLEMGLKSGDSTRLPHLSSCVHRAHGAILHPSEGESKDGSSFTSTFPSETLCPENTMQRLLPGVWKFSAPSITLAEDCILWQNADDLSHLIVLR